MKRSVNTHRSGILSIVLVLLLLFLQAVDSRAQRKAFIRAADGSVLDQVEQSGGKYFDQGTERDALSIFKKYGFTHIRLKLWHTPDLPYNGLPRVLEMAARAEELGLGIILDFHFSDTWADPGHQTKPDAWEALPFDILTDSVKRYTGHVISKLKAQQTLPEIVQIGNEITCGMLWDDGRVCDPWNTDQQWQKLGDLIKHAIQGMDEELDEGEDIEIAIHFADGGNNSGCRWFYDNIQDESIDYDIIAVSFYPWWHGTLGILEFNLNDLAQRYQKDLMVIEMAYPWTLAWNDNTNNIIGGNDQLHDGYPATVDGQYSYLRDLITIVKNTTGDRGIGVAYWSPEWISAPEWGSPWENVSLFDFENEVLESIKAFADNASVGEEATGNINLNCYPNPFQEGTTITFRIEVGSNVKVDVYSSQGMRLNTLTESTYQPGTHEINWDTTDFSPGLYLIRLSVDEKIFILPVMKT
jgi:arabinogalactan endo-1,4-beta-galactosidase